MSAQFVSGFSYTAPSISIEDWDKERQRLSAEEKEYIILDLHGSKPRKDDGNGGTVSGTIDTNPQYRATDEDAEGAENEEMREIDGSSGVDNEPATVVDPQATKLLQELDGHLESLIQDNHVNTSAYERALFSCPDYARDDDFRLMFLKADSYVPKTAAARMVNYWTKKLELFGEQVGLRSSPVRMSDLSPDDLEIFRIQGYQLLPKRDRHGRRIIYMTMHDLVCRPRIHVARWLWYVYHVALEDAEDCGLVILVFDEGKSFSLATHWNRKLYKLLHELVNRTLPAKIKAVHHFFDSKVLELVIPHLLFFMGKKLRQRYIIHPRLRISDGRVEELEAYALDSNMLPTVMGGTLELSEAQVWFLAQRNQAEHTVEGEQE